MQHGRPGRRFDFSRGSFYSYFDDRSSVAHSLATYALFSIELHIESKQAELSAALERLAMSSHVCLVFAIDHGPLAIVMIDDFVGRFPDIRTYLPETLDRGDRTLRAAVDDGELNPKSLGEINRDVMTGGLALSMKRLSRGFRASDDWLMDTTTGLLMALGAEATRAKAASQQAFPRCSEGPRSGPSTRPLSQRREFSTMDHGPRPI